MSQIHRLCQNQFQKPGIIVEGEFSLQAESDASTLKSKNTKTVSRTANESSPASIHGKMDATTSDPRYLLRKRFPSACTHSAAANKKRF